MLRIVLAVMMVTAIVGVVGLLVLPPVAAQAPSPSATRSFDKTTVEPGGAVVVTITVADYGATGGVAETPAHRVHLRNEQPLRCQGQRPESRVRPDRYYFLYVYRYRAQHDGYVYFQWYPAGSRYEPLSCRRRFHSNRAAPSGPTPSATRSFDKTTVERRAGRWW